MYAEVRRFIIRLTHLRKPWKHHDNLQRQVMVERLCFLFRWNSRHRKKIHGDYDDPTPCRHFIFPSKKVSPTLPQNIRHAATALTGMACSVAATIGAFFVSATPTKRRHIDRTVSHHPQHRRPWSAWLSGFCGGVAASLRGVGKLRSVHGAKNVTRLIMVQRIFSQPTVVLKVVFELKNTAFASFRMTGLKKCRAIFSKISSFNHEGFLPVTLLNLGMVFMDP